MSEAQGMTPAGEHTGYVDDDVADASAVRLRRARVGTTIADTYRIVDYLGSGGSSDVYRAEHLRLGKTVAIKMLRTDGAAGRNLAARFRREARAVGRLRSEHVVEVMDFGELGNDAPYLVMEFLAGHDLRQLLRASGSLSPRRAVRIAVEACFGLDAVHRAGLVHRDLKPENLFITHRDSGDEWCKVLDFGIVKTESSLSTSPGAIVGTIRYMAPEQLIGNGDVGPHSDIYALGAILYECLSGRPAHPGTTPQQLMYSVINQTPISLADQRGDLPPALIELVTRCLDKDHRRRPGSARVLAAQLQSSLGDADCVEEVTLPDHLAGSSLVDVAPRPLAGGWLVAGLAAAAATVTIAIVATELLAPPARLQSLPRLMIVTANCPLPLSIPAASVSAASPNSAPADAARRKPSQHVRPRAAAPSTRIAGAEAQSLSRFDERSPYAP